MPSMMKRFKAWLQRQPDDPEAAKLALFLDDDDTDDQGDKPAASADFAASPEYKKLMARIEAQDKALATFNASQSTHVADKALGKLAGKITPAQKPALLALFTQAAQDDADSATVAFSIEGQDKPFEGSRVGALLAAFSSVGDIKLTEELLDKDEHASFGAGDNPRGDKKAMDPYKVAADYKNKQMGGK